MVFSVMATQAQITVSGVAHSVHSNNVLRYTVDYTTDIAAKSWVDFYYLDGMDTVKRSTDIDVTASTSHQVELIGLVPQTNYTYTTWAFDNTGCYAGPSGTFVTDSLPAGLPFIDSLALANDVNLPGYLMTSAHSSPDRTAQIYDRKGNLIWYEYPPNSVSGTSSTRCKFNTWDPARRLLITSDCHRLKVTQLDGTVIRDVDLSSRPDLYIHHDMLINDDDNLVALVSQPRTIDQSSVGGSNAQIVMGQGFIEIDNNDNIIQEWHNFEHYDTLNTPAPGGYWVSILGATSSNWMHGNALMQDDDGNYIMSFKIAHQLAKISKANGSVFWKMGGTGSTIDVDPQDLYMDQHCINKTAGNNYLIFDNTSQIANGETRVMEFNIDFAYATPMLYDVWKYTLPQEFFTDILGSVYRLDNGNTLIATGRSRGIMEIDENSNEVWVGRQNEWVYRTYLIDDFYARETFTPDFATVTCEDSNPFAVSVTPSGGTLSGGAELSNGQFDPAVAGVGFHDLVYKYGHQSDTITIEVQDPTNCTASISENPFAESINVYPNPFSDQFTVTFDLLVAQRIKAEMIDITGKNLGVVFDEVRPEGQHGFRMNGLDIAAGTYLIRFTLEDGSTHFCKIIRQ